MPLAPRRLLVLAAAGLALVATACGGDDDSDEPTEEASDETTTTAETTPSTDGEAAIDEIVAEYQSCMADAGADMEAADAPTVEALIAAADRPPEVLVEMGIPTSYVDAHRECGADLAAALEAGATLPEDASTSTTVDAELAAQMHEAVACLNDRGWDFLEPGVETGPLAMQPRDPNFNMNDPAFLDDQRECQQLAGMM